MIFHSEIALFSADNASRSIPEVYRCQSNENNRSLCFKKLKCIRYLFPASKVAMKVHFLCVHGTGIERENIFLTVTLQGLFHSQFGKGEVIKYMQQFLNGYIFNNSVRYIFTFYD
ncbi:unnamed protein product [Chrysodeixis includens]|uniref:Uncharacterized protein n=1 Tax=Chrysodeixis includens TaxID=689277 RepID=A0A9N8PZ49_CHRIL|nr:unnamed protein product [Chrysodeixis includens]